MMFFFCIAANAQEKIYMPYFEVINMHSDYQTSSTRLLKTYIELENKSELVLPKKDTSLFSETKEQALEKAKSLNISHVLIGELNRMGETVIVSVTLYKTETGEKEWNTIQKALSPNDLDPIMQKIAYSINNRNAKNNSGEDINTVTDYNSKELNKMNANTYWGIEIGGGTTFFNTNNTPAGFGILYSGDLRNIIFDIKGSMYFSDVSLYNLSVHIYYPFLNKKSSPIAGGGLGYGITTMKTSVANPYYLESLDTGSGLTFFAGGGYIFNRTSNINIRINANVFYSLYEVDNIRPSGFLLGIAVFF